MASLAGKVALVTGAAKGSCQRAPRRRPTSPPLTRRRPRRCLMMLSYTFPPEASHEGWLPLPLTRRRPRPPPPAAGIGLACAQALGRAGARVLLADIDAEGAAAAALALAAEGVDAAAQTCDVGDAASVAAAVAAAVARFGRLDVAVANAGVVRAADFLEMSEADFDAVIRVNLKGTFLTGQAAARQMVKQGGGGYAIVNMGSVNGAMALPTIAGYNASKGGIHNLTRRLANAIIRNSKIRIQIRSLTDYQLDKPAMQHGAEPRAARHPRERGRARERQHADARGRRRRPRRDGARPEPHAAPARGRAGRDRGGGALPEQRRGKLRHGRNLDGRRRAVGAELQRLCAAGDARRRVRQV